MNKEVFVKYEDLRLTDGNEIAFRIEACLLETENQDAEDSIALPGIDFTVKVLSQETRGKADKLTGIFRSDEVVIDPTAIDLEVGKLTAEISAQEDIETRFETKISIDIKAVIVELRSRIKKIQEELRLAAEKQRGADGSDRSSVLEQAKENRELKSDLSKLFEFCNEYHRRDSFRLLCDRWNEIVKSKGVNHEVIKVFFLQQLSTGINNAHLIETLLSHTLPDLMNADWINELFKKLVSNFSCVAINLFPIYEDNPYSSKIIEVAAKKDPVQFFRNISLFEFYPWAKSIALEVAAIRPDLALSFFKDYCGQSWASAVKTEAEKAISSYVEKELSKKILSSAGVYYRDRLAEFLEANQNYSSQTLFEYFPDVLVNVLVAAIKEGKFELGPLKLEDLKAEDLKFLEDFFVYYKPRLASMLPYGNIKRRVYDRISKTHPRIHRWNRFKDVLNSM